MFGLFEMLVLGKNPSEFPLRVQQVKTLNIQINYYLSEKPAAFHVIKDTTKLAKVMLEHSWH